MCGNLTINVKTPGGKMNAFEANTAPLETTTAGINWSKSNDFSRELQLTEKDGSPGPKIYLRPDQVDAIRMQALGNRFEQLQADIDGRSSGAITVNVNGKTYDISQAQIQAVKGTLMQ